MPTPAAPPGRASGPDPQARDVAVDPAAAGDAFAELVLVMDLLRSPGGCPWDGEQTHASLAPYAIEEAYEVAEAAEHGDTGHLQEELGDLLLQVVFQARIGAEDADCPFDVVDVVRGLVAKLERRHPHVFGDVAVAGRDDVVARWEELKHAERPRRSLLDGVPLALPALARAQKAVSRARSAGLAPPPSAPADGDLGERILALVELADADGVDAEAALRAALDVYVASLPAAGATAPVAGTDGDGADAADGAGADGADGAGTDGADAADGAAADGAGADGADGADGAGADGAEVADGAWVDGDGAEVRRDAPLGAPQ